MDAAGIYKRQAAATTGANLTLQRGAVASRKAAARTRGGKGRCGGDGAGDCGRCI